jgi:hypothetical protein
MISPGTNPNIAATGSPDVARVDGCDMLQIVLPHC